MKRIYKEFFCHIAVSYELVEMRKAVVSQVNAGQDQDRADQQRPGNWFAEEKKCHDDGTYGNEVDEEACPGSADMFYALVVPDKSDCRSEDAEKGDIAPVEECIVSNGSQHAVHDGGKEK